MTLEILTAQELYKRKVIYKDELKNPDSFGNQIVMIFSSETERFQFAYAFVTQYLVPTYGRKNANKFPMQKTGPEREDKRPEWMRTKYESSLNSAWIAIPEDRFSEVEEFLKQYNLNNAPEPKYDKNPGSALFEKIV